MSTTLLGSTLVVDGEITGDDPVVIRGTVKGRVLLDDSLVVDHGGRVEAEVTGANVEVHGQVTGTIAAYGRVELKESASVTGDIHAPRIHIADGASFKGKVDVTG